MKNKSNYDLCIIGGLGRVGLPLGILFASKGLKVCLNDINEKFSKIVESGTMPFKEKNAQSLLKKVIKKNNLHISLDPKSISEARYIIITIGTQIDKKNNPSKKEFFGAIKKISKYFNKSQVIIVRSSVYPGICQKIYNLLSKRNIKHIAYCPERIMQGLSIQELKKLPQIVSGFSNRAVKEASFLFNKIAPKIIHSKVDEAELIKLFTNAWRYIQFATANEFFMICENFGINYEKIRKIMINNYKRAESMPTAGFAAGPCLYKDTIQLSNYYDNNFFLGRSAVRINENLPKFIVKKLISKYVLKNLTIGILGMAFKANIDDSRDSLSYKLKQLLKHHGAKVICSDEYIKDPSFVNKEELIQKSDIIIIGSPHDKYRNLNFKQKKLINIWNNNKSI